MNLTLDEALQKGIEAHKAGKAQEADQYYTAILKAQPKHPDANHNMGVLAVGVGKAEAALPFFKTALEANSSIVQYWLSYIDTLIKLGRIDDAKAVCEQARSNGVKGDGFDKLEKQLSGQVSAKVEATKDPPQDQMQALMTLYNQQKLQQVFKETQVLTKRYANNLFLWNLMGIAAAQLGKLDDAIHALKKAVSIKPDYAEGFYNIGNALQIQGKLKEAVEAFRKAVSIKPDYAEAYYNTGLAQQNQGKLEEAVEAYNKALSIKPDYVDAYNNMGNALQEKGKLEEAIAAYTKALSIEPNDAETYNNMGNTLQEQGKLNEAIEAYNKAISLKPDYAQAWDNLYFPLQTIKQEISSDKDLSSLYPKDNGSNYAKVAHAILQYRLNRGQENEGISFDKALATISCAENITIQNPTFDRDPNNQMPALPDNMVALVQWGRSGTGLMHSLIDGHPEVSTLPSIYFKRIL